MLSDTIPSTMHIPVEFEQEDDGRWIAEIPLLPGALAYGSDKKEALDRAIVIAFRILADRIEHGEDIPAPFDEMFAVPA
jgi:predicted RNase H-like HicB family nuclease